MTWRRSALVLIGMLAVVPMTGCGSTESGGSASCADVLDFQGSRYVGYGSLTHMPAPGASLGTAHRPGCDDGGGGVPPEDVEVFTVPGEDPAEVIMRVDDVLAREDIVDPEVLARLRTPIPCTAKSPFVVTAQLTGVDDIPTAKDGDLDLPVNATLQVTAGPEWLIGDYARIEMIARVDEDSGLASADLSSRLSDGTMEQLQLSCDAGKAVLEGLTH